jgi:hypothetical protein
VPDFVFVSKVLTLEGAVYVISYNIFHNMVVLLRFENLGLYMLREFSTMHTLPSFRRLQDAGIEVPGTVIDFYSEKLKNGPDEVLKTWQELED